MGSSRSSARSLAFLSSFGSEYKYGYNTNQIRFGSYNMKSQEEKEKTWGKFPIYIAHRNLSTRNQVMSTTVFEIGDEVEFTDTEGSKLIGKIIEKRHGGWYSIQIDG